jgi:uncharacterized membrane protein (DUF4010 family)
MTSEERRDAIIFLVIAFVALPLLPNRSFGPYGALNLHRITLEVLTFTATLARRSHDGEDSSVMVSAALLAIVTTFVQLVAVLAVGAAVLGNMVVKVVVSLVLGGRGFGLRFAAAAVPATAAFLLCASLSG